MKKKTITTMVAMAAIVALAACSNDEERGITPATEYITIDAAMNAPTTARSRATSEAFKGGDKISIYAWTGSAATIPAAAELVVNNSINTFDGNKWTAAPLMKWKDGTTNHFFIGIYPNKAVTNFTADNYAPALDLLVATDLGGRTSQTGDGKVPLVFTHVMSKLVVNLTFHEIEFGKTTPTVTSVTTVAKPNAIVDYLTKGVTASGTEGIVPLTATTANTAYECIAAAQTISKIVITIGGEEYTYTNTPGFSIEQGKIRTVNLLVGRNSIELGDITIDPWGESEIIDGGAE